MHTQASNWLSAKNNYFDTHINTHTSQRKRQAAKMVFVERKINAPLFVFLFIDSVTATTTTTTTKYAAKKDVENE